MPRLRLRPEQASDPGLAFVTPLPRLALEVGFGGGEHAAALAAGSPDLGVVACEVFENGICSLLSRLVPAGADPQTCPLPANLRLWDDDARPLMRAMPGGCLDLVALMFPDPWPKARHAKRRFVHPTQLPLVARLLKPGGEWRIASDEPSYQAWVAEVMAAQGLFHVESPVAARPEGWPATRYEAKALRAGRTPLYWRLERTSVPVDEGVGVMEAADQRWRQTTSRTEAPRAGR